MPKPLALIGIKVHTERLHEMIKQKKTLQSIRNLHLWTGRHAQENV